MSLATQDTPFYQTSPLSLFVALAIDRGSPQDLEVTHKAHGRYRLPLGCSSGVAALLLFRQKTKVSAMERHYELLKLSGVVEKIVKVKLDNIAVQIKKL